MDLLCVIHSEKKHTVYSFSPNWPRNNTRLFIPRTDMLFWMRLGPTAFMPVNKTDLQCDHIRSDPAPPTPVKSNDTHHFYFTSVYFVILIIRIKKIDVYAFVTWFQDFSMLTHSSACVFFPSHLLVSIQTTLT